MREGSAVADFLNPDRIVIGARSQHAAEKFAHLFEHQRKPVHIVGFVDAELIKCYSNAFLAMKISFANEVANMCDTFDADALHVLHGVGADDRIGSRYLAPGIGWGGPCFEKDVKSLIHMAGTVDTGSNMLQATLDVNRSQQSRVVDILEEELGNLDGKQIGVWGLAFKGGTSDVRDSLAIRVVERLQNKGAKVVAYDPAVLAPNAEIPCDLVYSPLDAANGEALVVLTDWAMFRDVDIWSVAKRLKRKLVVDGRNALDADNVASAGLTYRGIGRRRLPSEAGSLANVV